VREGTKPDISPSRESFEKKKTKIKFEDEKNHNKYFYKKLNLLFQLQYSRAINEKKSLKKLK
jgi:hypothetical protein